MPDAAAGACGNVVLIAAGATVGDGAAFTAADPVEGRGETVAVAGALAGDAGGRAAAMGATEVGGEADVRSCTGAGVVGIGAAAVMIAGIGGGSGICGGTAGNGKG